MSTERHPDRRRFLALGAGAFALAAVPALRGRGLRAVRRTIPSMGTTAEIVVVHPDERLAHEAIGAAFAELRRVESVMTRFRPDSDVGRVNRLGTARSVAVSPETAALVQRSLAWARRSGGRFDPCLGRAVELWDVTRRHAPPAEGDLNDLADRALWRALEVTTREGRSAIRLHDVRARLDLGGIAKGYGVDRAAYVLRERGVRNALVNVGGDLAALGRSPEGDRWVVGVRDPDDPTSVVARVALEDEAVATSGSYLQRFRHRGRTYHHLLDPRTAEPRRSVERTLTVSAPDCETADAVATAAFGHAADRSSIVAGSGATVRHHA